jgi:hypothetical protein
MRGNANSTGADTNNEFNLASKGVHAAVIVEVGEKTTKNGDPMAVVKLQIVDGLDANAIVYDNVVIPKVGSPSFGIMRRTMEFLKTIGEPHEGEFEYNTENWLNHAVKITVEHEAPNAHHKYIKAIVSKYQPDERVAEPF